MIFVRFRLGAPVVSASPASDACYQKRMPAKSATPVAVPAMPVRRRSSRYIWGLLWLLIVAAAHLSATGAQAHPHVWATIRTEVLFAPDGSVIGVRHAWTFDEMFSAFATTGIPAKTKGRFTREELVPLAKVNIESLHEYAFFTYARINGKRQKDVFNEPVDYWLDYDPKATVLTLHFTLPFKQPVTAKQLLIEVYDPEFFVDFGFAKENPVKLVDAPPQCTLTTEKPYDGTFQSFFSSEANAGMGMSFANKISVRCP
jgi:ABC-type uncharacterized transport system substrate-binding protein